MLMDYYVNELILRKALATEGCFNPFPPGSALGFPGWWFVTTLKAAVSITDQLSNYQRSGEWGQFEATARLNMETAALISSILSAWLPFSVNSHLMAM